MSGRLLGGYAGPKGADPPGHTRSVPRPPILKNRQIAGPNPMSCPLEVGSSAGYALRGDVPTIVACRRCAETDWDVGFTSPGPRGRRSSTSQPARLARQGSLSLPPRSRSPAAAGLETEKSRRSSADCKRSVALGWRPHRPGRDGPAFRGGRLTSRGEPTASSLASSAPEFGGPAFQVWSLAFKGGSSASKGESSARKGESSAQKGESSAQKGGSSAQKGGSSAQKGESFAQRGEPFAQKGG